MKRQARETVLYDPCILLRPMLIQCCNGPYDGETRFVTPSDCFNDLIPVGNHRDTICDIYRTAWRWTAKQGYTGIVLVWVNNGYLVR